MEEVNDFQAIVGEAIAKAEVPKMTVNNAFTQQLEQLRITSRTQVTPCKFLFTMFGIPCFPRGELIMVTGKKKSGKTFFSSIFMTLCYRRKVLCISRVDETPLRCVWIDTEQSNDSTHQILTERIMPMVLQDADPEDEPFDEDESFRIFNLRCIPWNERMQLIEAAIRSCTPDLVIIDGIRDVVDDINNGILAQQITESLMRLAQEVDCCIVSILHQNKAAEDRTPRGALGTEYGNKCFEEWEMKKEIESGMVVFTGTQTSTRKYDITNKLQFAVDAQTGLPVALTNEQQIALEQAQQGSHSGAVQQAPSERKLNYDYVDANGRIDIAKAFREVLQGVPEMRATVLQERFMKLVGIFSEKRYCFCLHEALNTGVLIRTEYDSKNVTYKLSADVDVPSEA